MVRPFSSPSFDMLRIAQVFFPFFCGRACIARVPIILRQVPTRLFSFLFSGGKRNPALFPPFLSFFLLYEGTREIHPVSWRSPVHHGLSACRKPAPLCDSQKGGLLLSFSHESGKAHDGASFFFFLIGCRVLFSPSFFLFPPTGSRDIGRALSFRSPLTGGSCGEAAETFFFSARDGPFHNSSRREEESSHFPFLSHAQYSFFFLFFPFFARTVSFWVPSASAKGPFSFLSLQYTVNPLFCRPNGVAVLLELRRRDLTNLLLFSLQAISPPLFRARLVGTKHDFSPFLSESGTPPLSPPGESRGRFFSLPEEPSFLPPVL